MNITERITRDRVLRGAREFSAELALPERVFDHLGPWDGRILRFLGRSWNAGSPVGRLPPTGLPGRTEETPQPGRPGANPTVHRPSGGRVGGEGWWFRMPSCTATRTRASWT